MERMAIGSAQKSSRGIALIAASPRMRRTRLTCAEEMVTFQVQTIALERSPLSFVLLSQRVVAQIPLRTWLVKRCLTKDGLLS